MSHACLYSPAIEYHRTLADTHFPSCMVGCSVGLGGWLHTEMVCTSIPVLTIVVKRESGLTIIELELEPGPTWSNFLDMPNAITTMPRRHSENLWQGG